MIQVPDLVGREDELAQLEQALSNAVQGNGNTILIAGEAGIGKTRITNELIKKAESGGALILRGWCLAESLEPLMPMRTSFREAGLDHLFTGEKPPKLLSLYLMDVSGLLISKVEQEESDIEPDIFAGMLTAVSNFVKDSLTGMKETGSGKGLNVMGYDNYRIIMEHNSNCSLAAVISGKENEFFLDDLKQTLSNIVDKFSTVIENWSGNTLEVAGTEQILQNLLNMGKYEGKFLVDDPRILQENLFDNVLLGIQRLSREKPVILFLDDLQWCDPSSLNLLHYLSRNIREKQVLILGTYRPEDIIEDEEGRVHPLEKTMQNMSREDLFTKITISRLDRKNTEHLVSNVLTPNDLEHGFFDRIHSETEGTPFYILEVIKLLIEERCLELDENGIWKLATDIDELAIPSKIYDVVKRRLDRVMGDQRDILESASVIGKEFSSEIIGHVLGLNRIKLLRNLSEIEKTHNLIHSFQKRYVFDHAKVREVLYNGIMDELRQEYHMIVAEAISETNKDDLDAVVGELAFHYFTAGDPRAGEFLVMAGDLAKGKFANEEAVQSYLNALNFIEDDEMKVAIHDNLGDVYSLISEYERSIYNYNMAIELELDNGNKASLHSKISLIYDQMGKYEESVEECQKGLALVEGRDCIEAGRLLNALSWTYLKTGDYKKADECVEKSLEIAQSSCQKSDIAQALQGRGTILKNMGDLDTAQEYLHNSQEISKELDDIKGLASTYNNMGLIHQHKGDLAKALEYFNMGLDTFRKIGKKIDIAVALINIGNTYIDLGDLDKALEHHEEGLAINRSIGAKSSVAHSLTCIGYVYYEMEKYPEVIECQNKSNEMCSEMGYRTLMVYNYYNMAEAEMGMGNIDDAIMKANKVMEISKEVAFPMGESMGRRVLGMAHRDKKDWERSINEFERSIGIIERIGDKRELARTKYEMGLLYSEKGESDMASKLLNDAFHEFEHMGMSLWADRTKNALNKTN